jgi:sortase A
MVDPSGPTIVRHNPTVTTPAKPGSHSHNRTRRMPSATPEKTSSLSRLRTFLLILGICALGYYGYSISNEYIYQAYQNWAFDQQIAGRKVAFADYVREKTPFGFLVGTRATEPTPANGPRTAAPTEGALLGRVEIGRLNLSAMVREGVDAKTLSLAVGHVPSTALPGQAGNFAIAAHRDTLFRALKDIRKDDLVTFQSPAGSYTYQVLATEIVKPTEVSVLQPDGGGLIARSANPKGPEKLLTMITCYPFYYVGSAPKRFIVEAKLVSSDGTDKFSGEAQNTGPPSLVPKLSQPLKAKPMRQQATAREPRPVRGSSHLGSPRTKHPDGSEAPPRQAAKKRGFWHKLLHV